MKEWLDSLAPRERLLALGGIAAVVLLLIYFSVWRPLVVDAERLRHAVAQQFSSLAWMRGAAAEVQTLKRSVPPVATDTGGSLLAVVDRAATQSQVKDRIRRLQPEGAQTVRVELEAVDFNRFIAWLGALQGQGIQPTSLSLTRVETSHQVEARLTLERSAK